ncbi:MAG: phospholipase D family protein [Rhodocyclaceae bacterium]|nr:phospholipase D family protein [Rhodocyclaceae bacterium]
MRWFAVVGCLLIWTPSQAVGPLTGGTVEVLFTPWDDAEGALLRIIGQAKATIHVQAYSFTSRNLGWALSEAKKRGVHVEILADHRQAFEGKNSLIGQLHEAKIPVRFETRYASAHNKVMIIDAEMTQPIVITGSYNFTFSAQARNAENLIFFRNNPPLAHAYLENWKRHRKESVSWAEGVAIKPKQFYR